MIMYKTKENYDDWNNQKQLINFWMNFDKSVFIKSREIWYIRLWNNIWFEEDGKGNDFKRPALILKKLGNMYLVVPMTTKWKQNSVFYLSLGESYFSKPSFLLKSQPKVIDKKRFIEKIHTISKNDFDEIKKELKNFWF